MSQEDQEFRSSRWFLATYWVPGQAGLDELHEILSPTLKENADIQQEFNKIAFSSFHSRVEDSCLDLFKFLLHSLIACGRGRGICVIVPTWSSEVLSLYHVVPTQEANSGCQAYDSPCFLLACLFLDWVLLASLGSRQSSCISFPSARIHRHEPPYHMPISTW